jgi:hypothetical protein
MRVLSVLIVDGRRMMVSSWLAALELRLDLHFCTFFEERSHFSAAGMTGSIGPMPNMARGLAIMNRWRREGAWVK